MFLCVCVCHRVSSIQGRDPVVPIEETLFEIAVRAQCFRVHECCSSSGQVSSLFAFPPLMGGHLASSRDLRTLFPSPSAKQAYASSEWNGGEDVHSRPRSVCVRSLRKEKEVFCHFCPTFCSSRLSCHATEISYAYA